MKLKFKPVIGHYYQHNGKTLMFVQKVLLTKANRVDYLFSDEHGNITHVRHSEINKLIKL